MKGAIKFVDHKTGRWGFIVPDDGSADVHLLLADGEGPGPAASDEGLNVELQVVEDSQGRHGAKVRLLESPRSASTRRQRSGIVGDLPNYAFIPLHIPLRGRDGQEYSSPLEFLAGIALEREVALRGDSRSEIPYPILDSYLKYTFLKLKREGKLLERTTGGESWATFDTGLVDRL